MNTSAPTVPSWLPFLFGGYFSSSAVTQAGGTINVQPGTQWYRGTGTVTWDLSQAGVAEGEIHTLTLVGVGTGTVQPAAGVELVSPATGTLAVNYSFSQTDPAAFTTVTFAWDNDEQVWVFLGVMSTVGSGSQGVGAALTGVVNPIPTGNTTKAIDPGGGDVYAQIASGATDGEKKKFLIVNSNAHDGVVASATSNIFSAANPAGPVAFIRFTGIGNDVELIWVADATLPGGGTGAWFTS